MSPPAPRACFRDQLGCVILRSSSHMEFHAAYTGQEWLPQKAEKGLKTKQSSSQTHRLRLKESSPGLTLLAVLSDLI